MDPQLLHLLVAGGLTLVGIVITALIWRAARVRTVMWWLGLTMLPVAVYLLGLAPQVVGAYDTLVAWYRDLSLTPMVSVGIGLGGLGLVLMLVSRLLPIRPRRKPDAAASTPAVGRGGTPAAVAPPAPAQPTPKRTSASQATPADGDLDEVTEILKRRGIE